MSRDRFEVIWRNFHFNVEYNEDDFATAPEEENDDEEEELVDLHMERIVHDQDLWNESDVEVEVLEKEREKVKLWYDKNETKMM